MTRRMDIVRRELISQTLAAAPGLTGCIWSPYQGPRPERPYAEWRPITQASSGGRLLDDTTTHEIARQVDVQVQSVVVGQPYRLDFNFTAVTSTPAGGATLTSIRDDLIELINADRDPVTASVVSADTLRLEGDSAGQLWRVIATGEFLEATQAGGSPIDIISLMQAPLTLTMSLNIYSAGVSAEGGSEPQDSSSFAHLVDVALRKQRVVAELGREHLAITRIAEPVNLDGVPPSQTAFESRTATDYSVGLPYWEAEFIEEIGTVEVTISTDKGSTTFTV